MATTTAIASFDLNEAALKFADGTIMELPAVVNPTLDIARRNQVTGSGQQFFWQESYRKPAADIANAASDTTPIEVAPDDAVIFASGDVVEPVDGDGVPQGEYILVTAVNVNKGSLTVTRGYVGTDKVTIPVVPTPPDPPWQLRRLYSSMKLNAVVYDSTRPTWVKNSNYFHRIDRKRTLTEDFERVKAFLGTQSKTEITVAVGEVTDDLARAITIGRALDLSAPPDPNPSGDATNNPAMNGFHTAWVQAKADDDHPLGKCDAYEVDTYAKLLVLLANFSYTRNKGHDTIFLGTEAATDLFSDPDFINALAASEDDTPYATTGTSRVARLRTPFGVFKIIVNEYLPPTWIYVMACTDLALVIAEDIQVIALPRPDNGSAFRIGGVFTLRYTNVDLWAVASSAAEPPPPP